MLRKNQGLAPQSTIPLTGFRRFTARRLVRDPVCGLHVDETRSIPFAKGASWFTFCSPACRDAYAGNVRKFAANG